VAVYSQWPNKAPTTRSRLYRAHRALITALSEDDTDFSMGESLDFTMTEQGDDSDPAAMGVELELKQTDTEYDQMEYGIIMKSKAGKAADLAAGLKAVLEGIEAVIESQEGPEHSKEISEAASIKEGEDGDDEVHISFRIPHEEDEEEKDLEEGIEDVKPSLKASLFLARTLQDMVDNKQDNVAIVDGGMKIHASAHLAMKLMKAGELMAEAEMGASEAADTFGDMSFIKSVATNIAVKYRPDQAPIEMPRFGDVLDMLSAAVQQGVPFSILKPLGDLHENADGVKSMYLRGLPDNWELEATFTEFHITPLLSTIIGDVEETPIA